MIKCSESEILKNLNSWFKKKDRNKPYCLIVCSHDPHAKAVLRRYHIRPPEELYNLENDPNETKNLARDPTYFEVQS
jgi:hypothetical protein